MKETQGHPILSRGDLVNAIADGQSHVLSAVAEQLGLTRRYDKSIPADELEIQGSIESAFGSVESGPDIAGSTGYPNDIEPIAIWRRTHYELQAALEERKQGESYLKWRVEPDAAKAVYQPLASWSRIGPRLRRGLDDFKHGKLPDLKVLVRKIAKRELLYNIPRRRRRRWGQQFHIVSDTSLQMTPFQHDHQIVIQQFRRLLPSGSLKVTDASMPYQIGHIRAGSQVLVLGDLGCLSGSSRIWKQWLAWGHDLRRHGCRLMALIPFALDQLPAAIQRTFVVQSWQSTTQREKLSEGNRRKLLQQLFVLASPAIRVEPGLLRDLRMLLPKATHLSLESDFWDHEFLSSNHPTAATINARVANEELRPRFEQLSADLRKRVLECIRRWRLHIKAAPEIWFEELLSLSESSRQLIEHQDDLQDAEAVVWEFDKRRQVTHPDQDDVNAWLHGSTWRLSDSAMSHPRVGSVLRQMNRDLHGSLGRLAAGTDPREVPGGEMSEYAISINDEQLTLYPGHPANDGTWRQDATTTEKRRQNVIGTLGTIKSSNALFQIAIEQSVSRDTFWKHGQKPEFVSDYGTDLYGAWFEFQVEDEKRQTSVTQRMRWIPPGTFLMGSPDDEKGRFSDEHPQHKVTLTKGFWFADTPCTQELWQTVMGNNPSRFDGGSLPVECVSWNDVQAFHERINQLLPGFSGGLPTEAQWEYACRAGSTTRYSFSDSIDANKVNFDQDLGSGKTNAVKSYAPNDWGLFDVHGNVREWCEDWKGSYNAQPQVDPTGPESGSVRVVRGGSWFNDARCVRSAYRSWYRPGDRGHSLGFRCLSSAESGLSGAEPSEAVEEAVAKQAPEQTRLGEAEEFFQILPLRANQTKPTKHETKTTQNIVISSDKERIKLERLTKPDWASDFGHDQYGMFADLVVPDKSKSADPVTQRLRWIHPGSFKMGSPEDEPGRDDNEVLHDVILTDGFWLFDTPCTQVLWQAVMGDNPSYFPDSQRPVETIDWDLANEFGKKLTNVLDEEYGRACNLTFELPTEAQWEYACRAGTNTAIYTGPMEILGDANATALDKIAWYGGNSGHEYDHDKSENVTWFSDKQYDFEAAGTRKVAWKAPNSWGMFDMLGDVWEWCLDWHGDYAPTTVINPTGPESGSFRVVRGGGWFNDARFVRSACRGWGHPGDRSYDLGFRCLSSAEPSQPRRRAE